jgi:type II restriction enzyme
MAEQEETTSRLAKLIAALPEQRFALVDRLVSYLAVEVRVEIGNGPNAPSSDWCNHFADSLLAHHANSESEFKKEHFEFAYKRASNLCVPGSAVQPKSRTSRFDLLVNNLRLSLKTQADDGIKFDKAQISKFMELGKGEWAFEPLITKFLAHLEQYDRILLLRALKPASREKEYELLEIAKPFLLAAKDGEMVWSEKSTTGQGHCYVPSKANPSYNLTFDGGGERKLKVSNIRVDRCELLARWRYHLPAP